MLSFQTFFYVYGDEQIPDNGIPVIYIDIDESEGSIYDMLNSPDHSDHCIGTIRIEVPEGFHYSDFPDLECKSIDDLPMDIRGRGNSTWQKGHKKPFKIKLDDKADLFGLGKNRHWVLVANEFDTTLLRDRITAWLGEKMGFEFTPRGVPVDLVLIGQNYGTHYLGSYYFSENVRVDKNRLEIDELNEDDMELPVISGGYLLQNSLQVRPGSPDRFLTDRGVGWATHTPSFDTEEDSVFFATEREELEDAYENHVQQEYIQGHIQKIEDALFSDDTSYRKLMDLESAAKYWLINEASLNSDAYITGSTYIYKKRDIGDQIGKLYWGPVWDFDYAWNNKDTTYGFPVSHEWIKALLGDKEEGGFVEEVKNQWPSLRTYMEELIQEGGIIDRYYEETKRSAEEDRIINHSDMDPYEYADKVDELKRWIRDRIDWMDQNIETVGDLVYKVRFVADEEFYKICFVENGKYLEDLDDHPEKEGYVFLGWFDEDGKMMDRITQIRKDTTLNARYLSDEEASHAEDITFRKDSDVTAYSVHSSSYQIVYSLVPEDAMDLNVEWSSSDEDYATVNEEGVIHFDGTGKVTVTAKLKSGKTRDFTLAVVEGELPLPEKVFAEEDEIRMKIDQNRPIILATEPAFARISSYSYSSEDENVVTVSDFGVLKAIGEGKTTVHVEAVSGFYEDSIVFEMDVTIIVSEDDPSPGPAPVPVPDIGPSDRTYRMPLTGIE